MDVSVCVICRSPHILFYLVLICMSVYLLRFSFQKLNSLRNHTQLVLYWSKLKFFVLFAFFYLLDCFFFNFFYYNRTEIYFWDIVLNEKTPICPEEFQKSNIPIDRGQKNLFIGRKKGKNFGSQFYAIENWYESISVGGTVGGFRAW